MNPKITVYITNYNYGKYIKEAIESVLQQTEQDFELIIIDDGSTDNSKKIIEEYRDYSHISIIYQKNKGLNATNNVAIKEAKGKYLIRLDADDYFHKNALKILSQELDNDDTLGLVFPNYSIVDGENNMMVDIKRHDFSSEVTLFDQPAHGACTMVRITYLKNVGGYDESFSCQDGYDLWIKFISQYKIRNVQESLFFYRQHGKNLTKNEKRLLDTRMSIKKKFVEKSKITLPKTLAIIPVRSLHINQLCFEKINGKTLLERKIEVALNTKLIDNLVIVSSDMEVLDFVNSKFSDERIICIYRPKEYSLLNSSLYETIELIFNDKTIKPKNFNSFIVLSLEYPFLSAEMIDNSIYSSIIFKVDTIISTRLDSSSRYNHNGSTMISLESDVLTKYERNDVYISKGGLIYSTYKNLIKNKKLPSGKIGHIIVDQINALEIVTNLDLLVAECIVSNGLDIIKSTNE